MGPSLTQSRKLSESSAEPAEKLMLVFQRFRYESDQDEFAQIKAVIAAISSNTPPAASTLKNSAMGRAT